MSGHSSKYYHIIKIIRNQKKETERLKNAREEKIKRTLILNCFSEENISTIMSIDNEIESERHDISTARNQILVQEDRKEEDATRLWEFYKKKSKIVN